MIKMKIEYTVNKPVSTEEFIHLLEKSTLAKRRPVQNLACMEGVIKNSNLIVGAWHDSELIGIARSVTDFHYACYLSDLAVDREYQKNGIGKKLLALTEEQLQKECKLILLAAPDANSYYEQLGFTNHPRCWIRFSEKNANSGS